MDAYMAPHPADGSDRRGGQSVFVHLVGLSAVLERGIGAGYATRLLGTGVARREDFPVAMIDRLVHHSEIVSLKGDSYRLKDKELGGATPPETA